MKPQAHGHEDKLLELAYGELPEDEARSLEAHVQGCARCTEALDSIRGVRRTMAQLPAEPPPDDGLDSLLAYAQQAARRTQAGPAPTPRWWNRWIVAVAGVAGLVVVGSVGTYVANRSEAPTASFKVAEKKAEQAPAVEAPVAAVTPPPPPGADKNGQPVDALAKEQKDDALRAEAPYAEKPARKRGLGVRKLDGVDPAPAPPAEEQSQAAKDVAAYAQNSYRDTPTERITQRSTPASEAELDQRLDTKAPSKKSKAAEPEPRQEKLEVAAAKPAAPPAKTSVDGESGWDRKQQKGIGLLDTRGGGKGSYAPSGSGSAGASSQGDLGAFGGRAAEAPASVASAATAAGSIGSVGSGTSGPSAQSLANEADAYRKKGDRFTEISLLRRALAQGATGTLLSNLLSRLCDAELSVGRGVEACERVVNEFPGTGAAQLAARRIKAAAPGTGDSSKAKAAPLEKSRAADTDNAMH